MAWIDPTEASIATLDVAVQPLAIALVNACRTAGWPVFIQASGARRSLDEQQILVQRGRSQTLQSKHVQGRAFDIDVLGLSRSEVPESFWWQLGPAAENFLGLTWGGRFKTLYDPGHFEV